MVNINSIVLLEKFFEKKGLVENGLTLIYIIKTDLGFRFSMYRARIWCENLQNLLFDQNVMSQNVIKTKQRTHEFLPKMCLKGSNSNNKKCSWKVNSLVLKYFYKHGNKLFAKWYARAMSQSLFKKLKIHDTDGPTKGPSAHM